MAKVMVSLPDGLRRRGQERARRVQQLMRSAGRHGDNGVEELKQHRPTS